MLNSMLIAKNCFRITVYKSCAVTVFRNWSRKIGKLNWCGENANSDVVLMDDCQCLGGTSCLLLQGKNKLSKTTGYIIQGVGKDKAVSGSMGRVS